jgi:hypothetical protein
MSDDRKPNPQDQLREVIKSVVNATNCGLSKVQGSVESWKQPVSSAIHTVEETTTSALDNIKYVYQRRHEYAPQIIGGTSVTAGGYLLLRRGRIAGVLGAAIGAGTAYAVVYDEVSLDNISDVVFGKK